MHRRSALAAAAALLTAAAVAGTVGATTVPPAGELISPERCAANEEVGTIRYLSGFDFAATPAIVDIVVAEANGYYDTLCLDVELLPSFATANYTLVAANEAQFASAGNFTEIVNYTAEGAEYVAVVNYGKQPIEGLVVPAGGATTLAELEGATIGVKGDIPPSLVAMLAAAGLERGADYDEVLLDGFDPVIHLETGIDALPVYKSNEPFALDARGIEYTLFDPAAEGIPGSFGIIYTSAGFAADHPTVVEDFVRASLKGMEDALADRAGAVQASWAAIDAAGNQNFLALEGERYRWEQDAELVVAGTPEGDPVGLIDPELFRAEYDAYVAAGVWPEAQGGPPEFGEYFDPAFAEAAYAADGTVRWTP
jgi:ABC-type nitrate/sulfonate/bicarbonate transport system substrate-binding protein